MSRELKSPSLSFKKLMGFVSLFRRGFNSSKCKTEVNLAVARMKLLRNKREVQVRQMRRDLAMLLKAGQDDSATIRVEHVIREQNVMAANEIIELFCVVVVTRLPMIAKQRDCPADLKEGISSLIYAAPRCSDIPELGRISEIFEKKYGKEFVAAARDLRPESGVNLKLIEKLSVRKPSGEVKMKIMKDIAKEYQIDWDTTKSEKELLKPPEELIEGPREFVSTSSMPVKPSTLPSNDVQAKDSNFRPFKGEGSTIEFRDSASAAQAAAESAERAVSAAQAAAYLAKQISNQQNYSMGSQRQSLNPTQSSAANNPSIVQFNHQEKIFISQSFNGMNDEDTDVVDLDDQKVLRRNSCAARGVQTGIKFDGSDGLDSDDEGIAMDRHSTGSSHPPPPPNRPPPVLPLTDDQTERRSSMAAHVHPNLPDYETLAARFESLRSNRF